jgi:predicted nucleotidyltransferase
MLLNNNALKILSEFSQDYSKRIYGGQVAKKLKMNQKTVANILNSLEAENILKYNTEGKNKYYFLNKLNSQIKDILKIVELGRKNLFFEKYPQFKDLFLELEKRTNGLIAIFGSYAKFSSNENSDLDVFVIGNIKDVEDLEDKYNIKINIVRSTHERFSKSDVFIKEVLKNHIILKGIEEYIELTWS